GFGRIRWLCPRCALRVRHRNWDLEITPMTKTTKAKSIKFKRHRTKTAARSIKPVAKASNKPVKHRRGSRSAEAMLSELKHRLMEISDLNFAGAVLGWDQATYMPPGGAAARGRQAAMLSKLAHGKSTDPALGRLLDALEPLGEELPYDCDDASLIRVARRDF